MSHFSTKKTEQLLAVLIVEITRLISPELSYTVSRLEAAGLTAEQIRQQMNGLLLALRRVDDARAKREAEKTAAPSAADLDAVAAEQKVQEETNEAQ